VPISLSGGRVFGTLCCLSHEPEPALAERDLAFMRLLARLAGDYVDRQELLARHEQERAETLARVTHDLRSPLQSIIGYAELLQSDAMPEYAATVASEALRLNGMLDELLEAQLPGAITFDLREVVAEQARVFRAQSGDHDILVEDAPEPVFVAADRARIVSVVANLLSNSIKYSPAGGRVEIRTERLAASARLSVRDEGVGIPDALQPSIFTRFFRATTAATRDISGTGLGLAFARDAVRDAGGEIGFTSVENDGSTFWIELPLAPGR
jgi:signal transduction histidine kinase